MERGKPSCMMRGVRRTGGGGTGTGTGTGIETEIGTGTDQDIATTLGLMEG